MIFGTFVAHHLIAQKVFNEMQYAKDKTAFTLNAPQTVTPVSYTHLTLPTIGG